MIVVRKSASLGNKLNTHQFIAIFWLCITGKQTSLSQIQPACLWLHLFVHKSFLPFASRLWFRFPFIKSSSSNPVEIEPYVNSPSSPASPPFFTVADRGVEDEGPGEEAAGAPGEAGRGSRQGEARLAEENSESRTRSLGVPEPDRCGLRGLGVGGELRNIPTIYAIRSSKIIILNRFQKLLRKESLLRARFVPGTKLEVRKLFFLSEKQQISQMRGNLFQINFYLFLLRIFF